MSRRSRRSMRSSVEAVRFYALALAALSMAVPLRGQHTDAHVGHGAGSAAKSAAAISPTSDTAAVAAVVRALFAAAERNDLVALDTLYAGDSLTVVEGAGINRGWADYRDHHLAPEMKEMKNFRYRPFEIEAHASGNLGWVIFRYALQATVGDKAIDNVGRGTAILERRGAKWVIRHTQTTSRPRRPADSPMPR